MKKKLIIGAVIAIVLVLIVGTMILRSSRNPPINEPVNDEKNPENQENYLIVNLESLSYTDDYDKIFQSSVFYNPRTETGVVTYEHGTEFEGHHTARLFGDFEIPMLYSDCFLQSECENSFMSRLPKLNLSQRQTLRDSHKNFVIVIWGMPKWLSSSQDESPTLAGHNTKALNAYSPKDYELWGKLVREMTKYFSQFEEVTLYFEIGSEPDLPDFWKDGTDAFLKFYQETAKNIKAVNPNAKVGGTAMNSWDGKITKDGKNLNTELISFAAKNNVPLDFISWHQYVFNPYTVVEASKAYEKVLQENNYTAYPKFYISEWNTPLRDTPFGAAMMAETFLAFTKANISLQTVAAWEDFGADPDPAGNPPYGLITYDGKKRPIYYVHKFFDRLTMDSEGIAIKEQQDIKMVVSKTLENNNCYKVLLWKTFTYADETAYNNAQENYTIELEGVKNATVLSSVTVKGELKNITVKTENNRLSFSLENAEVLALNICTEN